MKLGVLLLGTVCTVSASLLSVHFFVDADPEVTRVFSTDNNVVLEGSSYNALQMLPYTQDIPLPAGATIAYQIGDDGDTFSPPLALSFKEHEGGVLYFFEETQGYWVKFSGEQNNDVGYATFPVIRGGVYAFGDALTVSSPIFADVLELLRARLSYNVVAYRVKLVASPGTYAPILLSPMLVRGGCGGVPTQGRDTVFAQEQRTVEVLVNDVLTRTIFTFLLEMETTPEGCDSTTPLKEIF